MRLPKLNAKVSIYYMNLSIKCLCLFFLSCCRFRCCKSIRCYSTQCFSSIGADEFFVLICANRIRVIKFNFKRFITFERHKWSCQLNMSFIIWNLIFQLFWYVIFLFRTNWKINQATVVKRKDRERVRDREKKWKSERKNCYVKDWMWHTDKGIFKYWQTC